jgi:drug/metabolite transporter (DMT)-like permease
MIYLWLVSIAWGFSFGLFKGHLSGINPHLTAFLRIAIALPLFLPFFLKRQPRSLGGLEILNLLHIGAIQYGLMYVFYNQAYTYLSAHEVALFTITTPFAITFWNDLRDRCWHKRYWIAAAIAVIGAGLIVYRPEKSTALNTGFWLVQGANLCFAYGQVAYRNWYLKNTQRTHTSVYALLFLGAAILTALSTQIYGSWNALPQISSQQWTVLAYMGCVATGLCFFGWNLGATRVSAGTLAVMNNLKIPTALLISLIVFKSAQTIDLLPFSAGLILLFIGLYGTLKRPHNP